jgi:hypothetical protein
MNKAELIEHIEEYRDANSEQELLKVLMDKLVEELETWPIETERQRHDLNMMIRDLEEELDYIESDKLAEFDPEAH